MQIAGPMVAVLLLADVALALLTRVAPRSTSSRIGFPVKIMLTLLLRRDDLPVLPAALTRLVEPATEAIVALLGLTRWRM